MSSDIAVFSSVSSDVSMFVSHDMTYQLIQDEDGTYRIAEASTSLESLSQEVPDSTEGCQSSEDGQVLSSETDCEKTFQESLSDLFNSIQPEVLSEVPESTESSQSLATFPTLSDDTDSSHSLAATHGSSDSTNSTFQTSLDVLFNSIHSDVNKSADIPAPEMETDDRFGDPLHSLIVTLEEQQLEHPCSTFTHMPPNNPLARHPFFGDLCDLLQTECKQTTLPNHLFQTLGAKLGQVTLEKQWLEIRFQELGVEFPQRVKELSTLFQYHSAATEMERMRCVEKKMSDMHKTWLNSHFDTQILQLIERIKSSLQLLEDSKKPVLTSSWMSGVRHRPTLSKKAIKLMENWYISNLHHPYPSATVIEAMSLAGDINSEQVKKWFGNKRNRAGNTRTLTEIAKRKHRLRHVPTQQKSHSMIGSLALYI